MGGGYVAQKDRQHEGFEWGDRESRRIGSRRDVSGGGVGSPEV